MGLLNLIALSYLSIISIIAFLHFFNRHSTPIYVPSLIPWQDIKTDVVTSRMLRVNLLFLLQMFLIILLSVFLARPYFSSDILIIHGKNKVVVIDSSASMQTIEEEGSRFDQAKSNVLNLIDKMKFADKMMIISAYSSSEVISYLTGNKDFLRKSIEEFVPNETGTDLAGGISFALSYMANLKNSQLYVYTDQRKEDCGLKVTELHPKSFQFTRFGRSGNNVAISSFDIFQDMFNENDEAYITVENFSDKTKSVKLTVHIEDDMLMEKVFMLKDYGQKTFTLQNISLPGILKAQIETSDDLKVDNIAFGIIKKRKKLIETLMVTDSNRLKTEFKKLEKAFSQLKIRTVSTDEYNSDVLANYDICIFHKFIPNSQPDINSLFISPNRIDSVEPEKPTNIDKVGIRTDKLASVSSKDKAWQASLLPKGTIQNMQILDWDNTHPAMKYLNYLDNIKTYKALLFEPPKDATILIYASGKVSETRSTSSSHELRRDLPLAFSTKTGNRRTIVLGLDMEQFNYSDTNNLPILIMTLNMIQWLSPLGENVDSYGRSGLANNNQLKTGDLYPMHDQHNIVGLSIINNEGKVLPIPNLGIRSTDFQSIHEQADLSMPADTSSAIERYANYAPIKHTGIYTVKRKEKDEVFVVNLFNELESNIRPLESEPKDNNAKRNVAQTSNNTPLLTTINEINEVSRYILYLVPILLIVEWIYSFARKQEKI
ncbi:MAG: vWA domain-containing protein [Candidatus Anammoxibacter sp.]